MKNVISRMNQTWFTHRLPFPASQKLVSANKIAQTPIIDIALKSNLVIFSTLKTTLHAFSKEILTNTSFYFDFKIGTEK